MKSDEPTATRGRRQADAALIVGALLRAVWPAAAAGGVVAIRGAERVAYHVGLVTYVVAVAVQLRQEFMRRWFRGP